VGPGDRRDPIEAYEREGRAVADRIRRSLPEDWSFDGRRALDFGCGSARVLRHFLDEAERGELWGCDIDGPSIAWAQAHLSPPLHVFRNGPAPPLPFEDSSLDLVWAASVFTHIERWAPWLAELQRVLAPGGYLIASFLGAGMWEALVREPYREDEIGMTVLHHWAGPDADVLHSEWWLREHWGRAFEFVSVGRPEPGPDGLAPVAHSWLTLRRGEGRSTPEELERCDPGEPRELAAAQTNLRVLRYEVAALRAGSTLPAAVRKQARRLARLARRGGRRHR
jgi:SAM-dependent methyltransferase